MLFSTPMVRALLAGSKTQTRRICKPMQSWVDQACREVMSIDGVPFHFLKGAEEPLERLRCPHGQPGDRIWVRETWRTDASLDPKPPRDFSGWPVKYEADGRALRHGAHFGKTDGKTRVSMHMPRWASRILLEIVSVRVERLNDCSAADATAEGVAPDQVRHISVFGANDVERAAIYRRAAIAPYERLWKSINGASSWAANPWVWVIEFKQVPQHHQK
ncbi:hypothetical protein V3C40_01215 [Janthinobacterium sp. LS2A]|uniref:hypothetical protein n=1 Tax=Janthinobacterium sp. LS2A TaxID=3118590 RepID=UPI002F94CAC0